MSEPRMIQSEIW